VAALDQNPQEASVRFDEVVLTLDNVAKKGKLEEDKNRGMSKEEMDRMVGKMRWLYARAVRDRVYAKAKAEGKPLDDNTDTTTNEKYRSYAAVALRDQMQYQEALQSLRLAVPLLPDEPELLKDAVRLELSLQPIDWQYAEPLLRQIVKLNPKDGRAHFFLARYNFEQPDASAGGLPTAYDRRDLPRVEEAKASLKAAKENGQPFWRVAYMEADIANWELAEAKKGKNRSSIELKTQALEGLLFGRDGLLDRATRGVGLTNALSVVDAGGLFGVHKVAMRFATEGDGETADKAGRVRQVADSLLASSEKLAESKSGEQFLEEVGETLALLLDTAQPFLTTTNPDAWRKMTEAANAFLDKYPKTKGRLNTTLILANVTRRDSFVSKDKARSAAMVADAIKVLEAGLEAGKKANAPAGQLADFHVNLAEAKLLSNRPTAEVEAHIRELRTLDHPRARAVTNFLEGVLAARQGKLDKARPLFEAVTTDKEAKNTPLAARAIYFLAPVALATGDPAAAAGYYGQLADAYKQPKSLSPAERAWAEQTAGGYEEAVAYQVIATIQAGLKRVSQETRGQTGATPSRATLDGIAEQAERLAKDLRAPSPADRAARQALAEFRILTKDLDTADKLIAGLTTDYPSNLDVLKLQVSRTLQPAKGEKEPDQAAKAKAEGQIRQFVANNPDNQSGKLFWAQWLMANKRGKEAADYLRNVNNFPDQEVVKRLLANALAQAGEREEARKVLGADPLDPAVDVVLLEAAIAKMSEEQKKEVLNRFERTGLTKLHEAAKKQAEGKFEEAAREFNAAIEFAGVKRAALSLLQRALVGLAGQDPKKAAGVIAEYIGERPDEAGLYIPAALAALYLDEVGEPTDAWGTKRTMYAAVNRWEQLALKGKTAPVENIGLTKAQFHMLAGNPLLAREEAIKVNAKSPNHVPTLMFLGEQFIVGQDHNLEQAKKYIQRAQDESRAEEPGPELLYGAWLEASKELDGAAKHYELLTTRFAGNPLPYARRIAIAQAQKKTGEALLWANKWLEKFPDDPNAALQLIAVIATSGEGMDEAAKKANEYVTRQTEATEAQIKAMKPEPKPDDVTKMMTVVRAQAQLQVASVFFRAKAYPEAKKRVELVLKEIPDSPAALLMAGDIAVSEKDYKRAEEVYRLRLKGDPKDFVAANNLAWLLVAQKDDPKEAYQLVSDIRKGVGEKPISAHRLPADFLDTIGLVYVKLNDVDKYGEMRELFDGAVKRYPTDPRMYRFLGQAHAARGENAKALERLNTAVKLATDPAIKFLRDEQKEETKKAAEAALAKLAGK
jgi:predicted Zn-dependent protease